MIGSGSPLETADRSTIHWVHGSVGKIVKATIIVWHRWDLNPRQWRLEPKSSALDRSATMSYRWSIHIQYMIITPTYFILQQHHPTYPYYCPYHPTNYIIYSWKITNNDALLIYCDISYICTAQFLWFTETNLLQRS